MTNLARLSVLVLLAWTSMVCAKAPPLGLTTESVPIRVIDGDTIEVRITYVAMIRLKDVWAPEKNTIAGEKAWEDLEHKISGKNVVLHIPTEDARSVADVFTFGRGLGVIYLDGENINEWQVKRKNASSTKGGKLGD